MSTTSDINNSKPLAKTSNNHQDIDELLEEIFPNKVNPNKRKVSIPASKVQDRSSKDNRLKSSLNSEVEAPRGKTTDELLEEMFPDNKKIDEMPVNASDSNMQLSDTPKNPYMHLSKKEIEDMLLELNRKQATTKQPEIGGEQPKNTTESFGDKALRQIARTAKSAASGALGLPDLLATPVREGLNWGASKLGSDYRFNPTSEYLNDYINKKTNGYTAPRNWIERAVEMGGEGLMGLPLGYKGGQFLAHVAAKPLVKMIGKGFAHSSAPTTSNIGGITGSSLAYNASQEAQPENTFSHLANSIIGGFIGSGSNIHTQNKIPKAVGDFIKLNHKRVKSFKGKTDKDSDKDSLSYNTTIGAPFEINPTLADVIEGKNNPLKYTQNILARFPGSSGILEKAHQKTYSDIKRALGSNIGESPLSNRGAGLLAKEGAVSYEGKKNALVTKALDKVYAGIESGKDDLVSIDKPFQFYDKIRSNLRSSEMVKTLDHSPLGKEMKRLRQIATENRGGIPFKEAQEFRTTLDNQMSKLETGTVDKGRLSQLRKNLSDEMSNKFETNINNAKGTQQLKIAKEAKNYWDRYNNHYSKYANARKDALLKTRETSATEAENILNSIVSPNGKLNEKEFVTAAMSLKDNPDKKVFNKTKFVDTVINKLGKNKEGDFIPTRFAAAYNSWEPETQIAFKSQLPKHVRHKVDAVVHAIGGIKETLGTVNTSQTQYTKTLTDLLKTGAAGLAGASVIGIVPTAAIIGLAAASSKYLFANPKFINWAYKGLQSEDPLVLLRGAKPYLGKRLTESLMKEYQYNNEERK